MLPYVYIFLELNEICDNDDDHDDDNIDECGCMGRERKRDRARIKGEESTKEYEMCRER